MKIGDQTTKAPALREMPSRLLSQAATLFQSVSTDVFTAHEMHRYQFAVLATLDAFGPASQAELGRRTDIDRSDMTSAVGALESAGDIERAVDPSSRRQNIVALTAKGKTRFEKVLKAQRAAQEDLLRVLPEAEASSLMHLLTLLVDGAARRFPT